MNPHQHVTKNKSTQYKTLFCQLIEISQLVTVQWPIFRKSTLHSRSCLANQTTYPQLLCALSHSPQRTLSPLNFYVATLTYICLIKIIIYVDNYNNIIIYINNNWLEIRLPTSLLTCEWLWIVPSYGGVSSISSFMSDRLDPSEQNIKWPNETMIFQR